MWCSCFSDFCLMLTLCLLLILIWPNPDDVARERLSSHFSLWKRFFLLLLLSSCWAWAVLLLLDQQLKKRWMKTSLQIELYPKFHKVKKWQVRPAHRLKSVWVVKRPTAAQQHGSEDSTIHGGSVTFKYQKGFCWIVDLILKCHSSLTLFACGDFTSKQDAIYCAEWGLLE